MLEHQALPTRLDTLKPHPRNYREHPEDQLAHLEQSIREHGFYRNVVVAQDGTILAGHGVVAAARRLGMDQVPAIHLPIPPDSPQALKVLAGDNELTRLAMSDDRALSEILKAIKEEDETGLLGTGYDDGMLANLVFVTRNKHEIETLDHAKHWVGLPGYEAGEREGRRVVVHFDNDADREAFLKLIGVTVSHGGNGDARSIWWPPRERDDPSSVRFEAK